MQFIKQKFMGIELDILTGHPEHDLLFIATQVARAAGLKNPKASVQHVKGTHGALQVRDLEVQDSCTLDALRTIGNRWRDVWMFPESVVYQMLLRGHAPQSEPFRKWVTEEVLPAIRKTGSYNVNESETPEAIQFSGELAQLHQALADLTGEVRGLKEIIANL